jgi:uncharacterized protein YbgA (DUF1722 family)
MLSPLVGIVYVWRHSHKIQAAADTERAKMQESLNQVNEKRVNDLKEISERLVKVISTNTSTTAETNILLERLGSYLSSTQQSKKG